MGLQMTSAQKLVVELGDEFKLPVGTVRVIAIGDRFCKIEWHTGDGKPMTSLTSQTHLLKHVKTLSRASSRRDSERV